jgi:hypothetical protein
MSPLELLIQFIPEKTFRIDTPQQIYWKLITEFTYQPYIQSLYTDTHDTQNTSAKWKTTTTLQNRRHTLDTLLPKIPSLKLYSLLQAQQPTDYLYSIATQHAGFYWVSPHSIAYSTVHKNTFKTGYVCQEHAQKKSLVLSRLRTNEEIASKIQTFAQTKTCQYLREQLRQTQILLESIIS